jgi:ATP-dependent RNA helicase RhlE
MDKKVTVLEVNKSDYTETLALTEDVNDNWKKLIMDAEKENKLYKGKKNKKK